MNEPQSIISAIPAGVASVSTVPLKPRSSLEPATPRAWGFPSIDSDYDVRFIYLHRRDWYLSIELEELQDVIEIPVQEGLDLSGWDIRKALKLFRKSNPPLLEWIQCPIVYREQFSFGGSA